MSVFLVFGFAVVMGVTALLIWPLLRVGPRPRDPMAEQRIAAYRRERADIDRDEASGHLAPAEAAALRVELDRRLLRDQAHETGATVEEEATPRPASPVLITALVLTVPVASVGLYATVGTPEALLGPPLTRQAVLDRADLGPAGGDASAGSPPQISKEQIAAMQALTPEQQRAAVEGMVSRMADRIERETPNDAAAWARLARMHATMGHWRDAEIVLGRALDIDPANATWWAQMGVTRLAVADGALTETVRDAFTTALRHDPGEPVALWHLGLAAVQAGALTEARAFWVQLREQFVDGSPEYTRAARALAELDAMTGTAAGQP